MSESADQDRYVSLNTDDPIWERFFLVAPLVMVGTVEPDGTPDLAPKHLVGPASGGSLFGFVCTPSHATYRNVVREETFTVSYLRPSQVVQASLASATPAMRSATATPSWVALWASHGGPATSPIA